MGVEDPIEVEAAMAGSRGTKRKGSPARGDDGVEEEAPPAKKARSGRPRKEAPRKVEPPAGRWNLRPRKAAPEKAEPPAGRWNLRPRKAAEPMEEAVGDRKAAAKTTKARKGKAAATATRRSTRGRRGS